VVDAQLPLVLDACCGARMFWFDKQDPRVVFMDCRSESHTLIDSPSKKRRRRTLVVAPDMVADFTALPFGDSSFAMVVFDPPHLVTNGGGGWQAKKYGKLPKDWADMLQRGFAECFRVLKPEGTLVFKWNAHEVPVSRVLALTTVRPLVGNRCGKSAKSHWLVFMKGASHG
jgi:SAM-dependent methyltransferase